MKIQSTVTGRYYEQEKMCYILNHKQAALYVKHGCVLYDVMVSGEDKFVYVFDRAQTAELYKKWCEHELV